MLWLRFSGHFPEHSLLLRMYLRALLCISYSSFLADICTNLVIIAVFVVHSSRSFICGKEIFMAGKGKRSVIFLVFEENENNDIHNIFFVSDNFCYFCLIKSEYAE